MRHARRDQVIRGSATVGLELTFPSTFWRNIMDTFILVGSMGPGTEQEIGEFLTFTEADNRCDELNNDVRKHPDLFYWVDTVSCACEDCHPRDQDYDGEDGQVGRAIENGLFDEDYMLAAECNSVPSTNENEF